MAFVPFSGLVARSAIKYELYSQEIINTLWFERQDEIEWSLATLADLNDVLAGWVTTSMMPVLSNDVVLRSITSIKQDSAVSLGREDNYTGVVGELGNSAPSGTCITVKFGSGLTGRSYRGRNYVSGIPETSISGNQVTVNYADDLLVAYASVGDAVNAIDAKHIIASRFTNDEERVEGVTVPVLYYSIVDRNLDSQRRRLTGRGS